MRGQGEGRGTVQCRARHAGERHCVRRVRRIPAQTIPAVATSQAHPETKAKPGNCKFFNYGSSGESVGDLVTIKLRSVRGYLRREQFQHFWTYHSSVWGRKFLDHRTRMAMRSHLPPFKRFATTLRKHHRELLNWFAARGQFAHGATEGFNNKARMTTRKAYGFRTYEHAEIALHHALGGLPEPPWLAHRFC